MGIDKPLDGVGACRSCIARSPAEQCALRSRPHAVTRDGHGRPLCANCFMARSTALFQLAAEVPATSLARTLGISADVAVT